MAKKTRHEPHEEHADESWLLPYADLLTLLLALFIVLYSMSATDAKKFEEMSQAFNNALSTGNGVLNFRSNLPMDKNMDQGKKDSQESIVTDNNDKKQKSQLAKQEQEDLEKLKNQLDQYIKTNGLTNQLDTKLNQSQLTITISDNALFASGSAQVKPESRQLALAISNMLQQFPTYDVVVSGHTDNMPISNSEYASNWDLSSNRALNFLKILLTNKQLDPAKFTSTAFGEFRPVASNDTEAGRAKNRRVEVSIIRKYQDTSEQIPVTANKK
ncbi:flagellar motor protein MotB [Paenibacillus sp. XY044]|uniref:flagellar motor protein MotB n=1 Tax=Paenibacillus sp. XY044 TaxID=2026089 RepID=UPI000B98AD72|nr:flagellar motor protein MotB [Paenibacillus sp. XY044]OZB89999.1 flagellar motor protein MotB [Paenibacillus sp. XY044]